MLLERLRLQNFRQHADTTLKLEAGVIGIIGPNGAGKTTLLEAIAWAMYGTQAARGTRDSIRRRSAPARSRVEVELDFALGGHRYRVVRSLQTAALYQDGETAPIANSSGAVTDKVTRLFGMTREEFFNTYFTGQKELAFMAAMSAPDRARFLSRVLGYERLATVQLKLKEERAALKASLSTAETGLLDRETLEQEEKAATVRIDGADRALAAARAGLVAAERQILERKPIWEEWERRRDEVQTIETDLQIGEHQAVEARRTFQELDRDLAEAVTAAAKRDEMLPGLSEWDALVADRDRLDKEAQAYAGRRALEAQVAEVEAAVELMARHCFAGVSPTSRTVFRLRVTLAEALSNAILRGNDADPTKQVWIRAELLPDAIRMSVRDEGTGNHSALRTTPCLPADLDEDNGRGLFIINHLADRVEFDDRGNTIWMTLPRC